VFCIMLYFSTDVITWPEKVLSVLLVILAKSIDDSSTFTETILTLPASTFPVLLSMCFNNVTHTAFLNPVFSKYIMCEKKHSEETQTLHAGCRKAESKIFAPLQTPILEAQDGQNLISWRWSLPLPTNLVW